MQAAPSVGDFLANPMGRYFRGRRHAAFAHSPTLLGLVSWGRPDVDDVRELLTLCEIGLVPGMVPHRWLADLRWLELIEPATFGMFINYTRTHKDVLGKNIVRQAQLRPEGLVGAIISGFSHLARLPYPERVFEDGDAALTWLGVERDEGESLLGELAALRNASCESYDVVNRLRQELETSGLLPLEKMAKRLGQSTRSLQRTLRQAGTTYRMEVTSFRIHRAKDLLLRTEQSLTSIATEVGFSSVQHFATAYRRAVGTTPTSWRSRHRGGQSKG